MAKLLCDEAGLLIRREGREIPTLIARRGPSRSDNTLWVKRLSPDVARHHQPAKDPVPHRMNGCRGNVVKLNELDGERAAPVELLFTMPEITQVCA